MKVYSISRWAFYGICMLILVLPVSRHWRLLADGKKASGTVIAYSRIYKENMNGDVTIVYASEIQFQVEGASYKALGPLNYEYNPGRTVNVMYDPEDPTTNCVLTFSGFYLNNYLALPIILMVLWAAFYLSFNKYVKQPHRKPSKRSSNNHRFLLVFFVIMIVSACKYKPEDYPAMETVGQVSMKEPFWKTLQILDSALLSLQVLHQDDPDFGAIWCPHCHLYHTRAAEAVYPFAFRYSLEGDTTYRDAAIALGNWLIRQQEADGSWKETPEEWTGTTTDQLLMMALSYPLLKKSLSGQENSSWLEAMRKAGNYLVEVMGPEFASINYVATTAGSLMVLDQVLPDVKYVQKAKQLAWSVVAKMDDDYFITGEGGRVFKVKYGVDLTYNLEMSLWGLALYARLSGDDFVRERVLGSLKRHLHFIYPDGSLDGSWGIRSNKWTCYGGATSDGSQVLFSMFADEDPVYRTAALRNLDFLKSCMRGGMVGYGPHHWEILPYPPCIYPTFAKAKNLAMAHAFCVQDKGPLPGIPSDSLGLDIFPTLNIATARTENFHATVTTYGYKDPRGPESKYMHRPTGGAISNLWLKDYGYLQASSQTEYHRWEPMSFPEAHDLKSLTPRIEFINSRGYFTNLYEFDATSGSRQFEDSIRINIYGELKDRDQQEGGIGYSYGYTFRNRSVEKRVKLRFHDALEQVVIIEPIILNPGTSVVQVNDRTAVITSGALRIQFKLIEGNAMLSIGENKEKYWSPYPALKGYPLKLTITPGKETIEEELIYEFRIISAVEKIADASAGVVEIRPSMGETEINSLLNRARPGDTLLFRPGTYRGPFVLTGVHGDINQPVVITGGTMMEEFAANQGDGSAVIDGQTEPGIFLKHHAFLLQDCSWISIENFTIKNCWTDLIRAEDVSYLSVRHCKMTGGKRALFATGRGSHHFLVEHCSWEQDERVWTHSGDYSWEEIHHGVHKHFNGSLFQGSEISGVFVLRDNMIKNTFNAFRLSQMNDRAVDLLACTNGEIYRNTIINTSDNVLEPELYTLNLHFYHNRMINGHAFVSITEVTGGEIYIYGNTAVSMPDSDDGWTIFKISSRKEGLTKPFYIFNNSWYVDFDMIGSPWNVWRNNYLKHFNNACFSTKSDSFGIYNIGLDNHFDYDCSNVPFPGLLTGNGFEKNGLVGDPLFMDPMGNNFRLEDNSPCIDRGMMDEKLIMGYRGKGPDIGAYDNGELIQGPPFQYMPPEPEVPFKEMPRITRHQADGDIIKVWFSVPLTEGSVKSTDFKITTGGKIQDLNATGLSEDGYCLTLSAEQKLEASDLRLSAGEIELLFSRWPEGQNGMPVTSWASSVPVRLYGQGLAK